MLRPLPKVVAVAVTRPGARQRFRQASGLTTAAFIHVPGNRKHAWRNAEPEPCVGFVITTPSIGRFFTEIGRPITPGSPPQPPTPELLQHFAETAARYGHWLGSPADNAAVGITLG